MKKQFMLRKILFWIVGIPVAAAAILLSVANRHMVIFSLDPSAAKPPFMSFELPLYLLLFAVLICGILLGGIFAWIGQNNWRRKARSNQFQVGVLQREADEHKRKTDPFAGPALPGA